MVVVTLKFNRFRRTRTDAESASRLRLPGEAAMLPAPPLERGLPNPLGHLLNPVIMSRLE